MEKKKNNTGRHRRPVSRKHRKLRLQSLENRNLLAGDVGFEILANDVNGDGHVTASDALQVINALQSQSKGGIVENLASVDVNQDGVLSPSDALGVINQLTRQSETVLRDRIVERLSDRDPSASLGDGAILEIAQRLSDRIGEGESIEGMKELVSAARADVDPERREQLRERIAARRDADVDPERREQLRERIAARRAIPGAFVQIVQR